MVLRDILAVAVGMGHGRKTRGEEQGETLAMLANENLSVKALRRMARHFGADLPKSAPRSQVLGFMAGIDAADVEEELTRKNPIGGKR